ncbi:YbjN domain-containing protein [Anaerolineales bacterium]
MTLELVKAFFEEDGWKFQIFPDSSVLSLGFKGHSGQWMCIAQSREEQQQFIFYSVCPLNVPEESRSRMAEFLTRVNYGTILGNFEMDFRDGEIRYKTSLDYEGSHLNEALIRQIVYSNLTIFDHYWPGVMKVIYTDVDCEQILEEIENSPFSQHHLSNHFEDALRDALEANDDDLDTYTDDPDPLDPD